MDELLLIIARAHQQHLQEQAERKPSRRLRWRRLRTGRGNIVALPRHGAARTSAAPSVEDAA